MDKMTDTGAGRPQAPPSGRTGPVSSARAAKRPKRRCARCCAGPATIPPAKACSARPTASCAPIEEFFSGYDDDPVAYPGAHLRGDRRLRRDDRAARHPLRIPLRASSGADHRPRPYRLSAEQARRRHQQAGARARDLCPAAADPGEDDGADRQHHRRGAAAQGRRRRHRRLAPMHDHARRAQAGRQHGDQPDARRFPQRPLDPARVPRHHRQSVRPGQSDRTSKGACRTA